MKIAFRVTDQTVNNNNMAVSQVLGHLATANWNGIGECSLASKLHAGECSLASKLHTTGIGECSLASKLHTAGYS